MNTVLKVSIVAVVLLFAGATLASAGGRYDGYRHYKPYNHWRYSHYRSYTHGSSDYLWGILGATLLTTVLIHTLTSDPPGHERIVYRTPVTRYIVVQQPPRTVYGPPVEPVQRPERILRRVEITAGLLNVRRTPDPAADIVGQLRQGTIIDVIGAAPEWIYIKTAAGTYGWVMEQYTRPAGGPVG